MAQTPPPLSNAYVHGYNDRERERLEDQAGTLVSLLHHDTRFPAGSRASPEPGRGAGDSAPRRKPGGSITVIEGDHGSTFFHPDDDDARAAVQCQVELQRRSGGNANIGRQLYPLLIDAGFTNVSVSPRLVYVDGSRPDLIDGFTRKTFTAMIEGIRTPSIDANLMTAERFDAGVAALHRTATVDGMFSYMFFKATAVKELVGAAPRLDRRDRNGDA